MNSKVKRIKKNKSGQQEKTAGITIQVGKQLLLLTFLQVSLRLKDLSSNLSSNLIP